MPVPVQEGVISQVVRVTPFASVEPVDTGMGQVLMLGQLAGGGVPELLELLDALLELLDAPLELPCAPPQAKAETARSASARHGRRGTEERRTLAKDVDEIMAFTMRP